MNKAYTVPQVDKSSREQLGIDTRKSNSIAHGPVQPSISGDWSHPVRKAWADAFKSSERYMDGDPFIGQSIGAFTCLSSINAASKQRSHSASAYYHPARSRENLTVLTESVVQKILFDERDGTHKAVGVSYKQNNEVSEAFCSKEVILAAGALQTPKILELSGIGNPNILKAHGISVVKDLAAVGENLQDHVNCSVGFEAVDSLETLDALVRQEPEAMARAMEEYQTSGSGLLSSVGVYTYAYLPLPGQPDSEDRQALRSLLQQHRPPPGDKPNQVRSRAYYGVTERAVLSPHEPSGAYLSVLAQHLIEEPEPGKFLSIAVMLSQPFSRGSVHIQSADPSTPPAIDPNYFSNPLDLEILARHLMSIEGIAGSPGLRDLVKQPLRVRDPTSRPRSAFCGRRPSPCGTWPARAPCCPSRAAASWTRGSGFTGSVA
ncbi:GMC oxidoreductase-domain-containing protein [Xylariomycetidae sp. FL2044]|nr:GMC oxidoreductase-domain-containing protein [Xylariomycetidae sp. FL2044]